MSECRGENKRDMHTDEMCEALSYLEPIPPIVRELDKWGSTYQTQKAHMIAWFATQSTKGSGAYSRAKPNESARAAYNRMKNPGGLLWIAAALGEDERALREAAEAASEGCKAFRAVIPFDRIMELAEQPKKWRIDKTLLEYIEIDPENGWPSIRDGCEDEFIEAMGLDI